MLMAIIAVLAASAPEAKAATSCSASSPFEPVTLVTGDIIVTDITVNAVYRLTADGSTCRVVSSGGWLDSPRAAVVGPTGLIFVTDSVADAVIRIDPALPPSANQVIVTRQGAFTSPRGIVIDATGDFLVAEPEHDRIYRVNPASGAQSLFSAAGWGEETFHFPSDIALEANAPCGSVPETYGCLLVTDAPSTLRTISKRLLSVGPSGGFPSVLSKDVLLTFPRGVAVEASGDYVIADSGASGPPVISPSLIRIDHTTAPPTQTQTRVTVNGGLRGPRGIAVDPNGNLLVADFTAKAVFRIPASGGDPTTLLSNSSLGPWGIAVVGDVEPFTPSNLLVADSGAGSIVKVTAAGVKTPIAVTLVADPTTRSSPLSLHENPQQRPGSKDPVADAVTDALTDAAVRAVTT
jgi:DNA-binding beta-propeller fold protein YncE